MASTGVLDWYLWPIIGNLLKRALGPERGEKLAAGILWFMAELVRLVEGDPNEPDGSGPHKRAAVRENTIALLRELGVWSEFWLHDLFWRWVLDLTIDRVVAVLKRHNWSNPFETPDEATERTMMRALGIEPYDDVATEGASV